MLPQEEVGALRLLVQAEMICAKFSIAHLQMMATRTGPDQTFQPTHITFQHCEFGKTARVRQRLRQLGLNCFK